jgi:hypothetical protein
VSYQTRLGRPAVYAFHTENQGVYWIGDVSPKRIVFSHTFKSPQPAEILPARQPSVTCRGRPFLGDRFRCESSFNWRSGFCYSVAAFPKLCLSPEDICQTNPISQTTRSSMMFTPICKPEICLAPILMTSLLTHPMTSSSPENRASRFLTRRWEFRLLCRRRTSLKIASWQ